MLNEQGEAASNIVASDSQKLSDKSGAKTWYGRPSIFTCVPKVFLYLAIILVILCINYYFYEDSLEYHKYILLNFIDAIKNWQDIGSGFKEWFLIASFLASLFFVFKILVCIIKVFLTRYAVLTDQLYVRTLTSFGFHEQRAELYRVIDFSRYTSILGTILGFSTLTLRTTDQSCPVIYLRGVRRGKHVLDMLRNETERCRQDKGIREFTSALS